MQESLFDDPNPPSAPARRPRAAKSARRDAGSDDVRAAPLDPAQR
ncbi:MAG: hypothetical protein JWQ03_1658, partial [Variovorax sp.]|nr:hypothetical protein [Variovorax sp.]